MNRIAVIGSCITRDLWPVREAAPTNLFYVSRTSLVSLLAEPVAGFRPAANPPGGLRRHQHESLVADLRKTTLARLVAFRPTHLILDFIDERFDLLSVGGSVATLSWELQESGYLDQKAFRSARSIARLSAGCERLWRDSAAEFGALLRTTGLREAQLILHSARWADVWRDAGGRERALRDVEIYPGRPVDIAAHNQLLERYEQIFAGAVPALVQVAAPEHRLADDAHRWGLSPFHYVPEYYASILRQLEALGVEAVRSGDCAPSVPAA